MKLAIASLGALLLSAYCYAQQQLYDSYPAVAFSPDGQFAYFVMRATSVREGQDPKNPGDRAARAGVILKDQAWLKRVRLADDQVETLQEWTLSSAGKAYTTFKSLPVSDDAQFGWKSGQELNFKLLFSHSGADGIVPIAGIWDTAAGRPGRTIEPWDLSLPRLPESLRIQGTKELIQAGMHDGPKAIILYDNSTLETKVLAVSRPEPFEPYAGQSLLALAARSCGWAVRFAPQEDTVPDHPLARIVARKLTADQVQRLQQANALTPYYNDQDRVLPPGTRSLVEAAIAAPGKIASRPQAGVQLWVPDYLVYRAGGQHFQLCRIGW